MIGVFYNGYRVSINLNHGTAYYFCKRCNTFISDFTGAIVSAQLLEIDPSTGELVSGDIELETRRVLDNLGFVLRAGGADFADLVKTTIYLTDLADFAAVNRVYAERFGDSPPARATVQVSALPKGARVEIDGIAQIVKKSGS